MGYEKIIALDLGKFKTVACVMDPATRQHRFGRRKLAIVALDRKLLTICWSMLKHHRPFRSAEERHAPDCRPAFVT